MILELDCGNSLVKWRVLEGALVCARGAAESVADLVRGIQAAGVVPRVCRMVSVRSEVETTEVRTAVAGQWRIEVHLAQPARALAGVVNGYDDYQRLGLDRWLALVGAAQRSPQGCLVLDLGTAVTADYVRADGHHLGGFICPGVRMMCGELRQHTRRIQFTGEQAGEDFRRPACNTGDAVRRGSVLMLRSFVEGQVQLAREWLGEESGLFVTGGDSALVLDLVPWAEFVPDLVFTGLALACPLLEFQE